jgi:ACS family pantothenate transporter-like MFS transporter
MFSGYLQAAIYKGLDGHLGLAGWRWLFIFCGVISTPFAFWGYYAIPDNPYNTRARWLKEEHKAKFIARMERADRRKPTKLSWAKLRKIFSHWPVYAMTITLM